MRTIVLRFALLSFAVLTCVGAPAPVTPFSTLAKLATYLTENDASSAIAVFDSSMKGYGDLERNIDSLASQTDVLCAIDVVEDVETDGVHKLDLDWYITLTSQTDPGLTERRRERVTVEMRQIKGKWKITSLSPLSILDPIRIV